MKKLFVVATLVFVNATAWANPCRTGNDVLTICSNGIVQASSEILSNQETSVDAAYERASSVREYGNNCVRCLGEMLDHSTRVLTSDDDATALGI